MQKERYSRLPGFLRLGMYTAVRYHLQVIFLIKISHLAMYDLKSFNK